MENGTREDVLVSIKGIHTIMGEFGTNDDKDIIEMVNLGTHYMRDEVHYVLYDEIGEDDINKNLLKISLNKIELNKTGSVKSNLIFEPGNENFASYNTPHGELMMGLKTNELMISEEDEEINAHIEYEMSVNYNKVSDCMLDINIKKK
ncbi:MAG: DUF1934 domain-containing protein [Lachnospiraceae bacterium]|nr:DUF1934 domain-containing protein [Lachnospiraceae bacterium]MBO4461408.1 DUF1934 domain-containing protein [Lachnospiraceae bacterium]